MLNYKDMQGWIRNKVLDAGAEGVVIGLSGGVDSCVTSTLCDVTFNGRNVLLVLMPIEEIPYKSEDHKYAIEFLKEFPIPSVTVSLFETYKATLNTLWGSSAINDLFGQVRTKKNNLGELKPDKNHMLVRGNIKARLRMTTLYAIANARNYLVAGTSNKSELRLGYMTKHGDGAADFEPLADFYKTEVWEIAREIGISKSIIERPPSAGLHEGQTDEKELGFSYKLSDKIFMREEKQKHKVLPPDYYKRGK